MLNLLPIHNLARAIVRTNDQLLLCSSNKGKHTFYFLMGGHIEAGETAAQALERELQEELGISLRIESFLGCIEYQFTLPPGIA